MSETDCIWECEPKNHFDKYCDRGPGVRSRSAVGVLSVTTFASVAVWRSLFLQCPSEKDEFVFQRRERELYVKRMFKLVSDETQNPAFVVRVEALYAFGKRVGRERRF